MLPPKNGKERAVKGRASPTCCNYVPATVSMSVLLTQPTAFVAGVEGCTHTHTHTHTHALAMFVCQKLKFVPPREEVGARGRPDMPSGYYDATGNGLPNDFGR